jgi:DNA-binding transcriptional MerR regulator
MAWSTRELAELAGTTLKTVRHYHRIGLLDEPERAANGYKRYRVPHLIRLLRIRRLVDLGVPLSAIPVLEESEQGAEHPPLVAKRDFVAAQAIRAARPTDDGTTRVYLLAGLVRCRPCGRRMDAHWVNNRAGYRCRHGHTSAQEASPDRPKNLYVREDHILASLPAHLAVLELD